MKNKWTRVLKASTDISDVAYQIMDASSEVINQKELENFGKENVGNDPAQLRNEIKQAIEPILEQYKDEIKGNEMALYDILEEENYHTEIKIIKELLSRFHDDIYVHQASEEEYATLQTLADQLQAMYPNHHIVAIDNMIEWDLSTDDGSSLDILIMEDDEGNISSSILKVSYEGEPEKDSYEKQYNGDVSSIAQQIQNEIEKFM